jgi:hypothetical protein
LILRVILTRLQVTMRGAERPANVKWTRPCPPPLTPLSEDAALQTFLDIADDVHDSPTVKQLLELTSNLPLAVSLIANVAAHEGCDTALSRWTTERTRLLSDGYDKASSLDISITLSLSSSRMTAGAHELLSVLSMLPDGLSDVDLVESNIPIRTILSCKATLLRTSLAYTDHGQRLKVLVPIREYVYTAYPPSPELKVALRAYFHAALNLWDQQNNLSPAGSVPQISANLGNLSSVFLDAIQTNCVDILLTLHSLLLLSNFYRQKLRASAPILAHLSDEIARWKDNPIYGDYLLERLHASPYAPLADVEAHIAMGKQFFERAGELERGRCH